MVPVAALAEALAVRDPEADNGFMRICVAVLLLSFQALAQQALTVDKLAEFIRSSIAQKLPGRYCRPARQRATVVLPQPDGPKIAVTPVAGAAKLASSENPPRLPRNAA